jgi:hypothetical protein
MKRGNGFNRARPERQRTVHSPIPEHLRRGASLAPVARDPVPAIEKENAVRSEPYRRLVAALPCANCRREGRSQHAHTNGAGKGKGIKNDDRDAMPLCADDYGLPGCHSRFDTYALFLDREEHRRMGALWSRQTRESIQSSGLWPKNLEYPVE